MQLHINSYYDLKEFVEHHIGCKPIHELNYKYRLPGNRFYINLGEYKGKLFLEVEINQLNIVQIEWKFSTDRFIKEANMFNFKVIYNIFTVSWHSATFIKCPSGYDMKTENLFIETLMNLVFEIGTRYGLR